MRAWIGRGRARAERAQRFCRAHFGKRIAGGAMVKMGLTQAAEGLKPTKEEEEEKKEGDEEGAPPLLPSHAIKAELCLPPDGEQQDFPMQNRKSLSNIFYLTMILMLLLLGLILTSMYIYRYFSVTDSISGLALIDEDDVPWECQTVYADYFSTSRRGEQLKLREDVRINFEEHYEWINVPLPHLEDSDPADIIHDFQQGLTAYHDLLLDQCYVIELNTTNVLPLQEFQELLTSMKNGGNMPKTYIIEEEMIVMEPVNDTHQLGSSIYLLCHSKETYWLKRRTARRHIHRRAAQKCRHIHHFANTFVVDTAICQRL
ncbi:integral membrane protein 2C [Anolis sagrei]|uniref:integral membrane protein 2C n=1 Tax=Anolis sagrei TaxID=38937 RepID=UPI003522B6A5